MKLIGLACVMFVFAEANGSKTCPAAEPMARVQCHGILRDGIVAKGGETTGTTVKFDTTTWELDFRDNAGKAFAKAHHKQPVTITGELHRVKGVQIPVRWVLVVDKFAARDPMKQKEEEAYVAILGTLRHAATWFIDADGINWQLEITDENLAKANLNREVAIRGRLVPTTDKLTVKVEQLAPAGK